MKSTPLEAKVLSGFPLRNAPNGRPFNALLDDQIAEGWEPHGGVSVAFDNDGDPYFAVLLVRRSR